MSGTETGEGAEGPGLPALVAEAPPPDALPDQAPPPAFDRRMLEALVCPLTHAVLSYDAAAQELISRQARLAFPIRGGIPIMLIDEARQLD